MELRVAAVQMESENGQVEANLARATPYVEQAVAAGAQLVVLPELMPTGFIFTEAIWDGAESAKGPTVDWLQDCGRRWGIYIGTSFLEAEGEDFYNSFVLAGPDGRVAGKVRKQNPALWEGYFFRGEVGSHVIKTEIGKIGVGICYEAHLSWFLRAMLTQSADIVLLPHSCALPLKPHGAVSAEDIERLRRGLASLAIDYARWLGVPAVMVNKCGDWDSPVPRGILPRPQHSRFPGGSTIADSDASIKQVMDDQEGAVTAQVVLDPVRKTSALPKLHGRKVYPGSIGRDLVEVVHLMARCSYRFNRRRRQRARQMAARAE